MAHELAKHPPNDVEATASLDPAAQPASPPTDFTSTDSVSPDPGFLGRIIVTGCICATAAACLDALLYLYSRAPQFLTATGGVVLAVLCLLRARRLLSRFQISSAAVWIVGAALVAYVSGGLSWSGDGLYYHFGAALVILLVARLLWPEIPRAWLVPSGLYVLLMLAVEVLDPVPRLDVSQAPLLRSYVLGITLLPALVTLWHAVRNLVVVSIRSRLFVAFLLTALVPAGVFSVVSTVVEYRSGRQQVLDKLDSIATIKEAELTTWGRNLQTELALVAVADEQTRYMQAALSSELAGVDCDTACDELRHRLSVFVAHSPRLDELFLMNLDRRIVLSTDLEREGRSGGPGSHVYLEKGLDGEYLYPPSFALSLGGVAAIPVYPVLDQQGQPIGVLGGRAGPETLTEIMAERTGLGETGETYLVSRAYVMLTESQFQDVSDAATHWVFSAGPYLAVQDHVNGSGSYLNYRGIGVLGAYRWLPELDLALVAEQAQSEALGGVYTTLVVNLAVALTATVAASTLSVVLAGSIVTPLAQLVGTATRIAGGDLEHTARLDRQDELGALADAFNTMTTRLRGLVGHLEQRVAERTDALRHRAVQLETSTRVSREITSILDIDKLLREVVELIRRGFGYYYTGILLVDEEGHTLVLAADSAEGRRDTDREDVRLAVGPGSLNGAAALTRSPLLVNDVSQDSRYMPLRKLSRTRAELVVPLAIGERVLGTLDVQSAQTDAFAQDDVRILQSLGDQIAVAIENAHLYQDSKELAILEERTRLARELHDSVTQSVYSLLLMAGAGQDAIDDGRVETSRQHLARIQDIALQVLKELRLMVYELRPHTLDEVGLEGALRERLDAVERRAGIEGQLVVEGNPELPPDVEQGLFRIAQEALNNALQHSAASSVTVRLRDRGGSVELEVVDNGNGFDPSSVHGHGGVGLAGMRERAQALGASIEILSAPGMGTTVRVMNRTPVPDPRPDSQEVEE
jgi:nitrate/nitrite-specific signal transduction histidine kinase